jgi:hypothetical protein
MSGVKSAIMFARGFSYLRSSWKAQAGVGTAVIGLAGWYYHTQQDFGLIGGLNKLFGHEKLSDGQTDTAPLIEKLKEERKGLQEDLERYLLSHSSIDAETLQLVREVRDDVKEVMKFIGLTGKKDKQDKKENKKKGKQDKKKGKKDKKKDKKKGKKDKKKDKKDRKDKK